MGARLRASSGSLSTKVTLAFERLMGLVLTAIAIEMLLAGIQKFVRQVAAGA